MLSTEKLARSFNALAHPRRVRILQCLVETPEVGRSFAALQLATGFKEAPLLHHLGVMEAAGLLHRRRTGNTVARFVTPQVLSVAMAEIARLTGQNGRARG